jgi:hypothetical protein
VGSTPLKPNHENSLRILPIWAVNKDFFRSRFVQTVSRKIIAGGGHFVSKNGGFSRQVVDICGAFFSDYYLRVELNASRLILRHSHTLGGSKPRLQPNGLPCTPQSLVGSI